MARATERAVNVASAGAWRQAIERFIWQHRDVDREISTFIMLSRCAWVKRRSCRFCRNFSLSIVKVLLPCA